MDSNLDINSKTMLCETKIDNVKGCNTCTCIRITCKTNTFNCIVCMNYERYTMMK